MRIRAWLSPLLAAALLALPLGAAAQGPVASISVGSGVGAPGDSGIPVGVSLSSGGGAQVAGLNFDLTFDSSRLDVANVTIGSAASSAGKSLSWSQPAANRIRVIIVGFNQAAIPDGTVAVVSFDVLGGAAAGTSALTLSSTAATDPDGDPVTVDESDGSFEVLAPPATNTATASATATRTPTPTATATTGGPTATRTATRTCTPTRTATATRTPTRTRTVTPTPTHTRTPGGPTDTAAPTRTRTLTPTVTQTVAAAAATSTLSVTPTADSTSLSSATPQASLTSTPASGEDPGAAQTAEAATAAAEFEMAVAGTATALAEFDAAVKATATALAISHPAPTPELAGSPTQPDLTTLLVAGLGVIALVSLAALVALILLRRRRPAGS